MRRHELSDKDWSIIEPLLPRKSRGVKRVDDRRTINGSFGGSAPLHRGGMCRSAMAHARRSTTGSVDDVRQVSGTSF
jgi:hypothetical protein